jgi:membrane-associated protein
MSDLVQSAWQFFLKLVDIFLHLDVHLNALAGQMGPWLYVVLFFVIFAETGLVVTPFLPGDSLLFAVGALIALPDSQLSFPLMLALLLVAAIAGDAVNYAIGKRIGARVFSMKDSRWFRQDHLRQTQKFYERYGGKTIILARFVPIVRTFAPFIAGVGTMSYRRFALYNVTGGVVWVASFLGLGYFFGNLPGIKDNFHFVIVGIIFVSILPPAIAYLRSRREPRVIAETK